MTATTTTTPTANMISMREAIERVVKTSEEIFSLRRLKLENDDDDDEEALRITTSSSTSSSCSSSSSRVPIEKSVGCVSARDICAKRAHPVKDVSVMDGFCFNVIADDADNIKFSLRERTFRVNKMLTNRAQYEENARNEDMMLAHDECAYVTTGAVLPQGANCVVPEENVKKVMSRAGENGDDDFAVTDVKEKDYKIHKWIRKAHSDVKLGALLLKKGERIEWYDVGILAAGGIREVEVSVKPRVALACTGDEIVEVSKDHIPDTNASASYDVNGPALRSALRSSGAEIVSIFNDDENTNIIRDEESAVVDTIRRALASDCDVLITTGGASKGDRDYIYDAMMRKMCEGDASAVTCHFQSLSMKPGKPTKFFTLSRRKILGVNKPDLLCLSLPGNPVSCCVTFELLVKPMLRVIQGQNVVHPPRSVAKLGEDIQLDGEREEFHRVFLRWESENTFDKEHSLLPTAYSTGKQISSRILSMKEADALIELPVGNATHAKLPKGTIVSIVPIADFRHRGLASVRSKILHFHEDANATTEGKATQLFSKMAVGQQRIEVINEETTELFDSSFWRKVIERNAPGVIAVVGSKARNAMPDEYKQLLCDDVPGVEEILFELTNFSDISAFRIFSDDGRLTLVVVVDDAIEESLKDTETIKSAIAESIRGDETLSSIPAAEESINETLVRRTYARIGLLGNPSDQYFGEVVAVSIKNFYAETTLKPLSTSEIKIVPGPYDTNDFKSLSSLKAFTSEHGYDGGAKLLKALLANFAKFCEEKKIALKNPSVGFSLSYSSNIPKQTGMSGSSAIIISCMNCLLDRYDVRDKISKEERAFLALQVENDIGIAAGLMDRVIQVYGGCVHMNFRNAEKVKETGIGEYEYVDAEKIPKLFVVWTQNPSNSGKIHQPVRQRWLSGDIEIIQGMKVAADCARDGLQIIQMSSGKESCAIRLAPILSANFAARRMMFTDAGLGDENIRMIELCQSVGAGAKFTGSGGAVVACCPDGAEQEARLKAVVTEAGFSVAEVELAPREL
jgi:molybdenum cofactor synthesis domain-containing protein